MSTQRFTSPASSVEGVEGVAGVEGVEPRRTSMEPVREDSMTSSLGCASSSSCECSTCVDEDDEEEDKEEDQEELTSDEDVTEAEDSDDDDDAVKVMEAEVEDLVTLVMQEVEEQQPVTSDMELMERSALSLLGAASEEYLLEYLDTLPTEPPDAQKRQHLAVLHQPQRPPPQSPRLALLECEGTPLFQDTPIEQDSRLANWERWLADRRRQHRHLAGTLHRPPRSLAMNCGEDCRYLLERKQVLDYGRIPGPPDYFRGGPEFWKLPYFLPDHGDCDEPVYAAQMSKPDRGIVPAVEYVGVPDHVRREKEVHGRLDRRSPRDIWETNAYQRDTVAQMTDALARVETHEPDMRDLVIVGNYYQKRAACACADVPVVTVSEEPVEMREREFEDELTASLMSLLLEEAEGRPKEFRDLDGVACLRIQERDFYYVEPPKSRKIAWQLIREKLMRLYHEENPLEFRLTFASPPGKTETRVLRLENRGTVKVSYSWRRCAPWLPSFPVADLPWRVDVGGQQHFFFNKNRDLLLPGQVVELRVTYRSHHPGVFQECWTLNTEPLFVDEDDDDAFTVHLWGVTAPRDARDELQRLRRHVDARVEASYARDAIQSALEASAHAAYHGPPFGQSVFLEHKFLHVNPDYNYDGQLVRDLCEIHDVIATCATLDEWDLKIPTLRQVIVDHTEGERRIEYLDTLSEVALKLRKPQFVTRDVRLRKYTCVYNLLCNLANTIDREGQSLRATYGLVRRAEPPAEPAKSGKKSRSRVVIPADRRSSGSGKRPKTSKAKLKKKSSSLTKTSSSSSEESIVASETSAPSLMTSRMQSLTALFTPAAGYSESTVNLLATLTTPSDPVDPLPSVAMLPILLAGQDDATPTEVDENLVRRVYRQSLYVMVKEELGRTVEHISAVLDSYKQI